MINYLQSCYQRYFHDPQTHLLLILLVAGLLIVVLAGSILGALFASIVFAYALEGLVGRLQRVYWPRVPAVVAVFVLFLTAVIATALILLPLLYNQALELLQNLPEIINRGLNFLRSLPQKYPALLSEEQIRALESELLSEVQRYAQNVLTYSIASISSVFTLFIYFILVPVIVLFLLLDKHGILAWCAGFLPAERALLAQVWQNLDVQMGNYIRGKLYEIIIVGVSAYLLFEFAGLGYAPLLGVAVGLSVIVPYIGALAVTIPVMIVSLLQWGLTANSAWMLIAYLVLQLLDGYVLVPLLFSKTTSLHPIAVIAAILFFGGIWGIWGVFFAIPLATLIKVLIDAWPKPLSTSPA